jgi:D-alanine-D-alanine ligase
MNILILGGGDSPERAVSRRSATAVAAAALELGHAVTQLDPHDDHNRLDDALAVCDLVLPILHGDGGEDGTIQTVIEQAGKPYLGSGVAASRRCFDKGAYKELLVAHNLPTAAYESVTSEEFLASPLIRRPYVLKPLTGGSSLDTFIVRQPLSRPDSLMAAFDRYPRMLLEELIDGVETTIGVLDNTTLPIVEIIPPEGREFDYENKYNGATAELCPPQHVEEADQDQARQLAESIHQLMDCRHLSRTDIIITPQHQLYVLETNTIPGLTAQSLYPKAAAAAGIGWQQLVGRFIALAQTTSD